MQKPAWSQLYPTTTVASCSKLSVSHPRGVVKDVGTAKDKVQGICVMLYLEPFMQPEHLGSRDKCKASRDTHAKENKLQHQGPPTVGQKISKTKTYTTLEDETKLIQPKFKGKY